MNQNVLSRVLEFLRRKMWNKRWQRAVTCLAAVAVFGVTYALILPAITLSGPHPVLKADAIKAAPGEELEVEITARASDDEEGTTFVITALGDQAGISDAYVFDEDGVTLVKTEDGREIELHRTAGRKSNDPLNYWFVLGAGEEAVFKLELQDQINVDELVKVVSQGEYTLNKEASGTASASDAVKKVAAVAVKATASDAAVTASVSNATPADAVDEDGFLQDGDILNDLEEEEEEEDANVTATLKLSAGSGKDLEDAVRDAEKNADKRGDAQILFKWIGIVEEIFRKTWEADGVKVTLSYGEDAEIPSDAVLFVQEVPETDDEYEGYVREAEAAMSEAAGESRKASSVKLYDIQIQSADGTVIEPTGPVDVVITRQEGFTSGTGGDLNVVHFAEDGTKLVELNDENGSADAGDAEAAVDGGAAGTAEPVKTVKFTTDSFSKFAVVTTEWEDGKLTFEGEDYTLTISYTKEAGIPVGTQLKVEEIGKGSDQYNKCYVDAWKALNKDVLESKNESPEETTSEHPEELEEEGAGDENSRTPRAIADARFFDITFYSNDREIEPKVPVTVELSYKEKGLSKPEEAEPGIVHFAKEKTEVIQGAEVQSTQEEIRKFKYTQDSFSVTTFLTSVPTKAGDDNLPMDFDFSEIDSAILARKSASKGNKLDPHDVKLNAEKNLAPNGDGTYTLSLSVKGETVETEEVTKANVVVIMDESGSMYGTSDTYTKWMQVALSNTYSYSSNINYCKPTDPNKAISNANSTPLIYQDASTLLDPDTNDPYTGKVYVRQTRWYGQKYALHAMVHALMANNTVDNPDMVEIALDGFGTWARHDLALSSDEDAIRNKIDSLNAVTPSGNNYTNWESGFRAGIDTIVNTIRSDETQKKEKLYVVFLTDGEPNRGMKTDAALDAFSPASNVRSRGAADAEHDARDEARKIVLPEKGADDPEEGNYGYGGKLYSIFAYGASDTSKNRLRTLNRYAQAGTTSGTDKEENVTFFDASDTNELLNALAGIVSDINAGLVFGNVKVQDGVTGSTSSTITLNDVADTGAFNYTVSTSLGSTLYTASDDGSGNVTFNAAGTTAEGTKLTDDQGNEYYTATINNVERRMALATVEDGQVNWDLSGIGKLIPGYTYTLSFVVWPNQEVYDLLANLNNGDVQMEWDTASEVEFTAADGNTYKRNGFADYPYIVKMDDGSYTVLSNTDQSADYQLMEEIEEEDEEGHKITRLVPYIDSEGKPITGTIEMKLPKPMGLAKTTTKIKKVWNDDLDPKQLKELIEENPDYQVKFDIKKDGVDYHDFEFRPQPSGNTYTWPEYDLTLSPGIMVTDKSRLGTNIDKYEKVTIKGMTYYILNPGYKYVLSEEEGSDYHFEFESDDVRPMIVNNVMMFAVYTKNDAGVETLTDLKPATEFTGVNNLKGGINITKKVSVNGKETLGVDVPTNEQTFTIKVTVDPPVDTTLPEHQGFGYRVVYGQNNPKKGTENVSEGYPLGRSDRISFTDEFQTDIYDGDRIMVTNVPSGTKYTVSEENCPEIYCSVVTYGNPGRTVAVNKADEVTVTNTLISYNVNLKKVDGTDITKAVKGAVFNLKKADGTMLRESLTSKADGTIELGYLTTGTYYLEEVVAPEGFVLLKDNIEVRITASGIQYDQKDYADSRSGKGTATESDAYATGSDAAYKYTLTITNNPGAELPHTGGPGTMLYTFSGLILLICSALMYGFRRRHEERRAA